MQYFKITKTLNIIYKRKEKNNLINKNYFNSN